MGLFKSRFRVGPPPGRPAAPGRSALGRRVPPFRRPSVPDGVLSIRLITSAMDPLPSQVTPSSEVSSCPGREWVDSLVGILRGTTVVPSGPLP